MLRYWHNTINNTIPKHMSRKHYVKLAEIIKTNLDGANTNRTADEAVRAMAFDIASFCADDNGNFDADRFLRAAGVR